MFWHWVPRYMVGYVELMITKKRAITEINGGENGHWNVVCAGVGLE